MSNAHGTFIFGKSDDCIFDGEGLTDALNTFSWDADSSVEWEWDEDTECIHAADGEMVENPTLFPERVNSYTVLDEDDKVQIRLPNEVTEDELCDFIEIDSDPIELAELLSALSPFVTKGHVVLGLFCYEELRRYQFDWIIIQPQHSGSRTMTTIRASEGFDQAGETIVNGMRVAPQ